ncbi:MAG: RIO1 family regulatory kinase/ATPase [Chloroflexota bacterium]
MKRQTFNFNTFDEYAYDNRDRTAHRQHGNRKRKKEKQQRKEVVAALTDLQDNIAEWVPTYCASLDPQHHERQWVIDSIGPFYRDNIVTDVVSIVKGGKEANVYTCLAHPATGLSHIAAKLYRPRMLRHLKNDAVYKAGRTLRDAEGKQIKGRREKLALQQKTKFGKEVDIQWWIGNEFRAQQTLYAAGADVPQPIAHIGNTILMAHIGDGFRAAPTLSETGIVRGEAQPLFNRIMDNVAIMLAHHLIHGDLSAYNILYWDGEITIIDFPQMVEARHNPHAFDLLQRDIQRVADYFARYGVAADAQELALGLWQPYMGRDF